MRVGSPSLMKRLTSLLVGCALLLGPRVVTGAETPERTMSLADRSRVNLTIYNGSISLVHDRRRVALTKGTNRIAWRDVSGSMDATSAIVEDTRLPGSLRVLEQNFNFDLINPVTILGMFVGRDVVVVHDRPRGGRPERETARLLSDNDGVVLQYADRI